MDLLRRSAGRGRSGRWWDHAMWFGGVAIALLCLGLGLWSQAVVALGTQVEASVVSCHTGLQVSGRSLRHVTTCQVSIGQGKFAGVHTVDVAGPKPAGGNIELLAFRGTLSDTRQANHQSLLIPVGVLVLGATWWMGFPPKTDLTFGTHAAPRKPSRWKPRWRRTRRPPEVAKPPESLER